MSDSECKDGIKLKRIPALVNLFMAAFTALTAWYTKNIFSDHLPITAVSEESRPHLHWHWNEGSPALIFYPLFVISLILLSVFGLRRSQNNIASLKNSEWYFGICNALVVTVSYVWSYLIYGKHHAVGAVWCFMAAFGPYILLYLYDLNNGTARKKIN